MGRISIAGLLGLVAILAFGLAALVGATEAWAGATFTLTIGLLFASLLGVALRGWRGGGWLGFALFGWGYFLLGSVPGWGLYQYQRLLPDLAANWIFSKANPLPTPPTGPPLPTIPPSAPTLAPEPVLTPSPNPSLFEPPNMAEALGAPPASPEQAEFEEAVRRFNFRAENAGPIAHWFSVLAFAGAGAVAGVLLASGRRSAEPAPDPPDRPAPEDLPATIIPGPR